MKNFRKILGYIQQRETQDINLIMEGALRYNKPFYVVGLNEAHARDLKRLANNPEVIHKRHQDINERMVKHPMLIDNSVIIEICKGYEKEIYELNQKINKERFNKYILEKEVKLSMIRKFSFINIFKRIFFFRKNIINLIKNI